MSDFRVTVGIRNAKFIRFVESRGFRTLRAACASLGLESDYVKLAAIVSFSKSPLDGEGSNFAPVVLRFCSAAGVEPWELFSADHVLMELDGKSRRRSKDMDMEQAVALASVSKRLIASGSVEDELVERERNEVVQSVLGTLACRPTAWGTPSEREVIERTYGIGGRDEETLDDIAAGIVSRDRIRQIINKSLRKLRHPSRARRLAEVKGENV